MSKIGAIRYIGREISGIKTAFNAGRRCASAKEKSIFSGLTLGARGVYRRVGLLPMVTGVSAAVAVPLPGACATGIIMGNFLKKGAKFLFKLIK